MNGSGQDYGKTINIMTSCDDNIAKYILPQLASIGVNLKDYHIRFYLFHSRVSQENIELINRYSQTVGNIEFYEILIDRIEPFEELAKNGGSWPCEAYFWMCAHLFLPDDVERILYIDAGDIIINGDISEYYYKDFKDHSLVATAEQLITRQYGVDIFQKEDMGNLDSVKKMKGSGIFNSGSFIINISKLRSDGLTADDFICLMLTLRNIFPDEHITYFGDQGLAAIAFVGDIEYFGYPEIKNLWYMPYDFGLWFFDRKKEPWYTPVIIHYNGVNFKPWQARFDINEISKYTFPVDFSGRFAPFRTKARQIEFFEIWWKYCAMTPIYEETNMVARAVGKILEAHYLPLCKKFNETIGTMDAINNALKDNGMTIEFK